MACAQLPVTYPVAACAGDGTSKAPGRLLPGARAPDPEQCAGKAHAHAHAQAHPHARAPAAQLAALQVRSPTASPSSWLLRERPHPRHPPAGRYSTCVALLYGVYDD